MPTMIRTHFLKRTRNKPGRITATILNGPLWGYREVYVHRALTVVSNDAHREAATRLARMLDMDGDVREIQFRNTGSDFEVGDG